MTNNNDFIVSLVALPLLVLPCSYIVSKAKYSNGIDPYSSENDQSKIESDQITRFIISDFFAMLILVIAGVIHSYYTQKRLALDIVFENKFAKLESKVISNFNESDQASILIDSQNRISMFNEAAEKLFECEGSDSDDLDNLILKVK